jgi:hypothetical protein
MDENLYLERDFSYHTRSCEEDLGTKLESNFVFILVKTLILAPQ